MISKILLAVAIVTLTGGAAFLVFGIKEMQREVKEAERIETDYMRKLHDKKNPD